MCIALADIDHFKKINDKFGHVAGDMVLKLFAELLMMNIKGQDKVARFGGEEFAILFPDSPLADATATVNQIQKQLESKQWVVAASGERIGAITASFGVARLQASESAEDLIRRADAKLYEAKSSGRNRVLVDIAGETEREVEVLKSDFAGPDIHEAAEQLDLQRGSWTRSCAPTIRSDGSDASASLSGIRSRPSPLR